MGVAGTASGAVAVGTAGVVPNIQISVSGSVLDKLGLADENLMASVPSDAGVSVRPRPT